jgi:peptide deformylase|tara:strand:+ start:1949 stop:2557 length:609 start_codon:yes stop_codon:yes gene_type:complete
MIITEISKLQTICEEVSSIEEGEEIGAQLLKVLAESKNGIGLAANQIGINKQVCVVNVKKPIVLINPRIVEQSEDTFVFPEGCLSFPNKHIRTTRFVEVIVEADNHKGQLSFSADSNNMNDAFECACVQHEMDHLSGVTMFDREWKQKPYRAPKKFGRNERVMITNGKESKEIKYKKAEPLIASGKWEIYTPAMVEPGSYGK